MSPIPTLTVQAPHTNIDRPSTEWHGDKKEQQADVPIRYCLYARKSEESDERQALSIDSQINTMMAVAKRDDLEIVEVRRESHSAKDSGQRPVFKQLMTDIRSGLFTGIANQESRLMRSASR